MDTVTVTLSAADLGVGSDTTETVVVTMNGPPGATGPAGPSGGGPHAATHAAAGSDPVTLSESQITGLTSDLAGKVGTGDSRLSDARTPTSHAATHAAAGSDPVTLAESQVTNLTTDLAGKASTVHAHAESDVTSLVADLAGKATMVHTHAESDVTSLVADLAAKVPTTRQVIAGTGLTGGGTLAADRTLTVAYGSTGTTSAAGNDARLSDARTPTAHASTHAVAGGDPVTLVESQVTGLTADLAARQPLDSDLTAIAALDASTAGSIASDGAGWIKKTYAQFKTALGLVKADVGLGNVDNTADASKTFTESQITGLVSDLAAKQPLDSDLTTIASLTATTDGIMQAKASAWSVRTPAQVKTDLVLTKGDVGLGNVDNTADSAKTLTEAQITNLVADLAAKVPIASTYLPADLGYSAWTQDPNSCRDNSALTTAGRVQLTRLIRVPAGTITNIEMCVVTIGATLTAGQNFAALYSVATGALLGTTADQAAAWVVAGSKTMAISGGAISWGGGDLWVAVFYNGTTGPAFLRSLSGASANGKAAAASARFTRDSVNTGRTTTMPGTLGTLALDNTFCHWAALS
jgi:hypothetical protein